MIFDSVLLHYMDGSVKSVPCDAIASDDGWLILKSGEIVIAFASIHNVKLAELYYQDAPVGMARAA